MRRYDSRRLVFLGAAAFALVVVVLGPDGLERLPGCLFHEWTGLLCAGCGSTRALAALSRGDLQAAVAFNPLTVAFLVALPVLLALRGRGWRPAPTLVWGGVAALALFWTLRNVPLPAFDLLRP